MSEPGEKDNLRPGEQDFPPTASFDDSVARPGGRIGHFRIERELGRGAAGIVYLARDTKLNRSVAIKTLPADLIENHKVRTRFAREARLLASLNHPNIATIYDEFQESEGLGYLILEYVPGRTLAERIAKSKLKLEETLMIASQIAEAVSAAHEHGVIHRDLKPGNIKITPEGKVKVLDFGLAKALGGEAQDQHSNNHRTGPDYRHAGLYESRAGPRPGDGQAQRHLLVRLRAVRDADGDGPFQRPNGFRHAG